jgi:prepilin-type N-terminal cleavage/methylation domain-containing protein
LSYILKKARRSLHKDAFTLLELAIAVAIFVIAACGILSLYVSCSTLTDSAGNITSCINRARQEFEDAILRADFETLSDYTLLPPNVPNGMSLICTVSDHPTIADVKQVRIVVNARGKSNRVTGEDENVNAHLDGGEDINGDGRLTSPCEIVTFITRTE